MRPDQTPDPDESERESDAGRRPAHSAFELPIIDPDDQDDELDDLDDEADDDEDELDDEALSEAIEEETRTVLITGACGNIGRKLRAAWTDVYDLVLIDKVADDEDPEALCRIVAGFLFSFHGAQKLLGAFGGMDGKGATAPLASLMGVGGVIELVGGLLILVGLFTSWAAFLASGMMAVAYFMAHQPSGTWPIQNHGETAALYAFVFLYIAARGSGIWSLDHAMGRGGRGVRTADRVPG